MNTQERNLIMLYLSVEKGYSNRQLADMYNLTTGTVRNYLYYLKKDKDLQKNIVLGERLFLQEEERKSLKEKMQNVVIDVLTDNSNYTSCAYIVRFDTLQGIITKVGYTTNFKRRSYELQRKYGFIDPLAFFCFDNEEDGYMMEILLHKYYKEKGTGKFIPQDRFIGDIYDIEEDLPILLEVAEELRNKKWF